LFQYNLYVDLGHTEVFGDGAGDQTFVDPGTTDGNGGITWTIYASAPAEQHVPRLERIPTP